ncbi:sialin-like isoform X2 [Planococcus citri]|uniref:sialin-like isoform X2 n=1 Tax=Planococcus citri TaxID=170843 RepID=UPI0031F86AEF
MVPNEKSRLQFCSSTNFLCLKIPGKIFTIPEAPPLWLSRRMLVVMVLFSCLVVSQILRNHMNITVVEMTSNKTIVEGNTTIIQPADYDWDSTKVALVISMFAYGGLFSFFGGFIVDRFGGSVTCAICMIISGIATLLHPIALQLSFDAFLACRFVTGLSQTFFYISVIEMYSRWFPKKERSRLVSFSFNGSNAGVALAYPVSGCLGYRFGWRVVFYVIGVLPLIMSVIVLTVVRNLPSQDRRISRVELEYILKETSIREKTKVNNPYKDIFTSGPFWSLCCAMFTYMWIATNLGVTLPLYVNDLTQKNSEEVGWISSIPSVVYTLMFPFAGILMDYYSNKGVITLTRMHKIMISIAFLSANIFFITSTFIPDLSITLGFFVLIDMLMSSVPLIIEINTVSLSPDHAGIVGSLVTFSFSVSAIAASTVTGFLISNHTITEWNRCFYLASVIAILGAIIFVTFGSSESQVWSPSKKNNENNNMSDMDSK